jgi:hypothetical protein
LDRRAALVAKARAGWIGRTARIAEITGGGDWLGLGRACGLPGRLSGILLDGLRNVDMGN